MSHSVVLLAFGSDSLVELLSGTVVLLAFSSTFRISRNRAARAAGILLFALAGMIAVTAVAAILRGVEPKTSPVGIAITIAALCAMPILAWRKRKLAGITGSRALAADSIQSATCAWLAAATLAGLALNAAFHLRWIDPVTALAVLPLLIVEGRKSMRGESCNCCSC